MTAWAIRVPTRTGGLFSFRRTGGGKPNLSEREQAVFNAVRTLSLADRDGAYGATIRPYLEERGVRLSIGALYIILRRLEKRGVLISHLAPGGPERGNRRKRCYTPSY